VLNAEPSPSVRVASFGLNFSRLPCQLKGVGIYLGKMFIWRLNNFAYAHRRSKFLPILLMILGFFSIRLKQAIQKGNLLMMHVWSCSITSL